MRILVLLPIIIIGCNSPSPPKLCEEYEWRTCKDEVLFAGAFPDWRDRQCSNDWHELRPENGVAICRCKHRPECEPPPNDLY